MIKQTLMVIATITSVMGLVMTSKQKWLLSSVYWNITAWVLFWLIIFCS